MVVDDLIAAAKAIHSQRYAHAEITFLAGSLVRGEGTSTSDLDLVVVFKTLPEAYRESFRFGHWPVEAFVHDPQTLAYFFHKVDKPSGVPSLPTMVSEGIEIPQSSEFSRALTRISLAGHTVESVMAADENVDALYKYLIGGGS